MSALLAFITALAKGIALAVFGRRETVKHEAIVHKGDKAKAKKFWKGRRR